MSHFIGNRCLRGGFVCLLLAGLLLCGCDNEPKTGKGGKSGTKVTGEKELIKTLNGMKQIILAFHKYNDANKVFPPAYTVDANGKPLHSWRVLILPYVGQGELYNQIRLNEPWDSEYNKQFHNRDIACYHSGGTDSPKGFTDFSLVVGPDTITDGPMARKMFDISDGLSNTILLVERTKSVCWMDPTEVTQEAALLGFGASPDGIAAFYNGGEKAIVGLCDGWASPIRTTTATPEQIQSALSLADGKHVSILQDVTRD